jgi:hypothetical protein
MCSEYIRDFLDSVSKTDELIKERIRLVLDNARMHKTNAMKTFAVEKDIDFLFLPSHSPYLNICELAFRYAQTSLKRRTTMKS